MGETARDRVWIAALALARVRAAFTADDVLDTADLPDERRRAVRDVLETMREYGFLDRGDGDEWRAGGTAPVTDADPSGFEGAFTYLSAPNTRWTFAPDAVREWLESRLEGRVLDPFAGPTRLRHEGGEVVRNDLDETVDAEYHVDAHGIADHFEPGSFDTVVLDPPLSTWRADGDGGTNRRGTVAAVRNAVVELVRLGGLTITFGRSSSGMGAARGFETEEICLVNHPGESHDTIAVVERRRRDVVGELRE